MSFFDIKYPAIVDLCLNQIRSLIEFEMIQVDDLFFRIFGEQKSINIDELKKIPSFVKLSVFAVFSIALIVIFSKLMTLSKS